MNKHRQLHIKKLNLDLRLASENDMSLKEYRELKQTVSELKASTRLIRRYGEYEDIEHAFVDNTLGLMIPIIVNVKNKQSGIAVKGFNNLEQYLEIHRSILPLSEKEIQFLKSGGDESNSI